MSKNLVIQRLRHNSSERAAVDEKDDDKNLIPVYAALWSKIFACYIQFILFLLTESVLRHKLHKSPNKHAIKLPFQGGPGSIQYVCAVEESQIQWKDTLILLVLPPRH